MGESEWLASDDPAAMLAHVQGKVSDRKLMLFAVACCRQVWDRLTDGAPCNPCGGSGNNEWRIRDGTGPCPDCSGTGRVNRSRRAVETAERYADGEATEMEFHSSRMAAHHAWGEAVENNPAALANYTAHANISVACQKISQPGLMNVPPPAVQAALLRGIVGNPFRTARTTAILRCHLCGNAGHVAHQAGKCPVLRWRNGTIPVLARKMYDSRDFSEMGILHDMLIDAGCTDEDMLRHCRGQRRCHECLGEGKSAKSLQLGCDVCDGTGWLPAGPECGRCGGGVPRLVRDAGGRWSCSDCSGTGHTPPLWCRGDWVVDLLLGRE